MPQTREVVKAVAKDFPLSEVPELLMNRWHEVRLCGFLILVAKFEKLATKRLENDAEAIRKRDEILTMYLQYAEQANNWDLVDLSVHKILGHWLLLPSNLGDRDYKIKVLDDFAKSPCLWKQRMSIVCTWKTSQMGDPSWCLRYAEIHLHHPHDLMHKAVGWMLREMGKRALWTCCATSCASMPRDAAHRPALCHRKDGRGRAKRVVSVPADKNQIY